MEPVGKPNPRFQTSGTNSPPVSKVRKIPDFAEDWLEDSPVLIEAMHAALVWLRRAVGVQIIFPGLVGVPGLSVSSPVGVRTAWREPGPAPWPAAPCGGGR